MIETVDIGGAIPALDGADGWAFTVSNVGGSKIDTFLTGAPATRRRPTRSRGHDRQRPDRARQRGPDGGLPRYVIGNRIGEPDGTSSLWVTIYSPLGLDRLTVDGEQTGFEVGTEQGWNVYRVRVDIPSMTTVDHRGRRCRARSPTRRPRSSRGSSRWSVTSNRCRTSPGAQPGPRPADAAIALLGGCGGRRGLEVGGDRRRRRDLLAPAPTGPWVGVRPHPVSVTPPRGAGPKGRVLVAQTVSHGFVLVLRLGR